MPFKTAKQKKPYKKRRTYRTTRVPRSLAMARKGAIKVNGKGQHYFTRWATITGTYSNIAVSGGMGAALSQSNDSWNINTGTTANLGYFSSAHEFEIAMLPDYTEFTTLFDQYRIAGVKVMLTPYSTTANLQTGIGATASNQALSCIVHHVIDYDDFQTFPASVAGINSMREYPSYKCTNLFHGGKPIKRFFKPHNAIAVFGSGAFTSYANQKAQWIDAVSTNVQHYGWKMIIEVFQPDSTVACYIWYKLEAKVYLELKNPR